MSLTFTHLPSTVLYTSSIIFIIAHTVAALAGISSANAALRGVLPTDMKDLLNDKFAAVGSGDDGDHCVALRGQACNIPQVSVECFEGLGVSSSCKNLVPLTTDRKNGLWGPVCSQPTQHDLKFVEEEATASGLGNCKVLPEGYECVNDGYVGLECQPSLVCVGYVAPTGDVGELPILGRCEAETETNGNAGDHPGNAQQCTSYFDLKELCSPDSSLCNAAPAGCSVTCELESQDSTAYVCKSTTEDVEEVTANAN